MKKTVRNSCSRLLVVDDEDSIRFALCSYFRGGGFDVDASSDREEALALLSVRTYDVVIADLRLTTVVSDDGLEIVRTARENHPATAIILLTSFGTDDIRRRADGAGVDLVLQKPQALASIAESVDRLLRGRAR